MAMEGIFSIRLRLEDPFNLRQSVDAIDVSAELWSLRTFLKQGSSGSLVYTVERKSMMQQKDGCKGQPEMTGKVQKINRV